MEKGLLAKYSPIKAKTLLSKRSDSVQTQQIRWWLSGIERSSLRAPASVNSDSSAHSLSSSLNDEIKVLSFDDDDYLSEYLELNEGMNEFQVHFSSSQKTKRSRLVKILFTSRE